MIYLYFLKYLFWKIEFIFQEITNFLIIYLSKFNISFVLLNF
jgi:hypothetical protein